MNYAWEAALEADCCGIPREELRYIPVRDGSPYTEVVQEDINNREIKKKEIEINPLYRYAKEFSEVLDINLKGYEKTRLIFFDICMQYLVQLDLRQGMSRQEYALRFLFADLLDGVCGSQASEVVRGFEKGKLHQLLRLILKLYRCGSSISLFREVMRCLYPDSLVYAGNEAVCQVLIYVGVREEKEERERLKFLQDMFLPLNYEVFLFWEHHFGIIDVKETMELDEMVLF